jgi:exonuclease SbcD
VNFSFLHAADFHLGSPLLGLSVKDAEIARRFASASREAFRALVDQAISAKAAFAVIAGDVYGLAWTCGAAECSHPLAIARVS